MDNNLILTTEMFEEAERYWRDNLSGELMEPAFPGDYSRNGQYGKGNFNLLFDKEASDRLSRISKQNDFLLNVCLLTVFKILIYKFTGQNDIVVSSSVLKTSSQDYNKCIALRDFVSPGMTFRELLSKVKETAADGYKYQYYPIKKLIELLNIENPPALFKFSFLLDNIHEKEFLDDVTGKGENDIVFSVNKKEGSLEGEITYNSKLFKEETVQKLCGCYMRILTGVLNDTNIKISDINILTEEEKKKILIDFNNTGIEYPKDKTLHQLFDRQVEQRRDFIVIAEINSPQPDGIHCISFGELSKRANRFAIQLMQKGTVPGSIISLMLGHSIDLMVGILGILKAGCVYLPLDPDYPIDRINYMLKDSGSSVLLITGDLVDKCKGIEFEGEIMEIGLGGVEQVEDAPLEGLTAPGDPAYIIYTSGSTGKPKGVMVEHTNVVRLVKNMNYIDFSGGDRILPTGAVAFDISTFELWGPLLNGVRIYFAAEHIILDPEKLAAVITGNKINILHLIPQLFNQAAAQKIDVFAGLKYLLVGGDIVRPGYINKVRNTYENLKILQMYGPTENTTFTTFFPVVDNYEVSIPIGKPVSNSTVYILDRFYNIQPIGVVGELWTGGDGVARGYLNSPELTVEKFVDFSDNAGKGGHLRLKPGYGTLYKTGDLGRWLPDGNIEFVGRQDSQVKIRGFRIEPGEIEAVLSGHEGIEEAVIIIKTDEDENPYLCAYFTSVEAIETNEIREYLSRRLPDYMIPLFFVRLEEIPLTPNGKIDRKALPEPEVGDDDAYMAPRDEIEKKLVEIWSDVLRVEKDVIGIDSNFFHLGGHSLKATHLAFSIHRELNTKVTLNRIFKTPTIRELARYIKSAGEHKYSSIASAEKKEYYVLSSAQKRIYISQQMAPESLTYNMPAVVELEKNIERTKLENVFLALIRRHESLRTSFHMLADEPVQKIHQNVEFNLEYLSLTDFKKLSRPFDLSRAPLLRAAVLKTETGKHYLWVDVHHIISDGTSIKIFEREFTALCNGGELSPLRLQYKDFSEWQNRKNERENMASQEAYWLKKFEGGLPVLDLPTDYERGDTRQYEAGTKTFSMDNETTEQLHRLAAEEDTTLYILLMTIYNILLFLVSGQRDIVVGIPIAGRRHLDLENIIGMFVNMLALRSFPNDEITFREFLQEVKKSTLEAYENQDYQFDDLVAKRVTGRNLNRNQMVDVVFNFDNITPAPDQSQGKIETAELTGLQEPGDIEVSPTAIFDLQLNAVEVDKTILMSLIYSEALFKPSTIDRMLGYFTAITGQVIENKDIELKEIVLPHDLLVAGTVQDDPEGFEF